jgi:hypothetical protein
VGVEDSAGQADVLLDWVACQVEGEVGGVAVAEEREPLGGGV